MKIENKFPDKARKIFDIHFLNIYFLNVDIFLIIHDPSLKFVICIDDILVEGNVSFFKKS